MSHTASFRESGLKGGIRLAVAWLLFGIWLALVFGGLGTALSQSARYPRFVGWLALCCALIIAVATMEKWVRALPGVFAYGTLNGMYMTWSGHVVNDPSSHISRANALLLTLLGVGAMAASLTFASRRPTSTDRVAILGVLISFFIAITDARLAVFGFSLMFFCLVMAWAIERVRSRR
jgi:hypothetical protein